MLIVCEDDARQRLVHTLLELNLANNGVAYDMSDAATADLSFLLSDYSAVIMEVTEQSWPLTEVILSYVSAAPGRALIALLMSDTLWNAPVGFVDGVLCPQGRSTSLDAEMLHLCVNTARRRSLRRVTDSDFCHYLMSGEHDRIPLDLDFVDEMDRAAAVNATPSILDGRYVLPVVRC